MKFRQLVKTVDKTDSYIAMVEPEVLKAQYNPERFHLWKSLHKGQDKDVLNMMFSPHYRYLKNRKDKSYYQLQRYFGRNDKWIKNKIQIFLLVLKSIENEGFKGNVEILEKSLVDNIHNDDFEIFEGHHRVSCALFLKLKKIPCRIIRR